MIPVCLYHTCVWEREAEVLIAHTYICDQASVTKGCLISRATQDEAVHKQAQTSSCQQQLHSFRLFLWSFFFLVKTFLCLCGSIAVYMLWAFLAFLFPSFLPVFLFFLFFFSYSRLYSWNRQSTATHCCASWHSTGTFRSRSCCWKKAFFSLFSSFFWFLYFTPASVAHFR